MCGKAEEGWWWLGPLGGCLGQTLEGFRLRGCLAGGLSGGLHSQLCTQGHIWYRTPCVRARLHLVFLPGLGPPSPRARLPPAARRGHDPPFQVQRLISPLTGGGSTSFHRPTKPHALVVSEVNLRKFVAQSTVRTVQHMLTTAGVISS
jgi:hypothetical protein